MKKCAIVDFFSAHDHLIPSAIQLYSDLGYEVTVFNPSKDFASVSELIPSLKYKHVKTSKKINNAKGNKYNFFKLMGLISLPNKLSLFDVVYINTFRFALPICIDIAKKCNNVVTILHTPHDTLSHESYKCFADLGHKAGVLGPSIGCKYNLPWIAPLTYVEEHVLRQTLPSETVKFCVPGTVRFDGRSYFHLIESVQQLLEDGVTNFEVTILGRVNGSDGSEFIKAISKSGLESTIKIVSDVSHEDFFGHVIQSDFILPLVDKYADQTGEIRYNTMATSTDFLAIGLEKIMVCEEEFAREHWLSKAAICHPGGDLKSGLLRAIEANDQDLLKLYEQVKHLKVAMYSASLQAIDAQVVKD